MKFQDAIETFSAISTDQTVLYSIDDGMKQIELFNSMVRRFGLDQRKTNLKLDEMTEMLERFDEQIKLSEHLQEQLDTQKGDRDQLVQGIIAISDLLEDLYRYYEQKSDDPLYNQINLMWSNIHAVLRALGLFLIDKAAIPYDPHLHDIELLSSDENYPAGQVLRILRSGYADRTSVLRKARIIINEASEPDREDDPDAET